MFDDAAEFAFGWSGLEWYGMEERLLNHCANRLFYISKSWFLVSIDSAVVWVLMTSR